MDWQGKYYDDDGNEMFPSHYPKPQLCLSCSKNDDPNELVLCNLNRLDQVDEPEFKCYQYENAYSK